jgi:hypothetical protein
MSCPGPVSEREREGPDRHSKEGPGQEGPGKEGGEKKDPGKEGPGKEGTRKDVPNKHGVRKEGIGWFTRRFVLYMFVLILLYDQQHTDKASSTRSPTVASAKGYSEKPR